jgi:hypothetical protein
VAEVLLKADRASGSFTIDPTTLVVTTGDEIHWSAKVVEGEVTVLDDAPYVIQFTGATPLTGGHMLMRNDKSNKLETLSIGAVSGRFEYAAAVTDRENVFIHTSGETLVDPGSGIG